ncbi:sugar transferase [Benzoatithermus flavus]|uniref:sugar transferase n=1 Tax=Benzoatithermus flavus TaxID=3108223 RepID=UPI003AAAA7E1
MSTSRSGSSTQESYPWHAVVRRQSRWSASRVLDLVLAPLLLVLAAPLLLAAAALIWTASPGPILFRQTRIGQHGRPFTMLKLRTMYVASDDLEQRAFNTRELLEGAGPETEDGIFKLEHDPRIVPACRWLRRLSIDELPQLINVIRGDMALVGPRPCLPWEVELFTPRQRRRDECRPGITGLWQVSGRNRLSMPEMLELDLAYVERRSLRLDLVLLLRTPYAVLFDCNTR